MSEVFRVPATNIMLIISLLAAGMPLVSGANVGRAFSFLSGDEIYDSGLNSNDDTHAVVLIGSGVTNYPGKPTVHNHHSMEIWPLNPSTNTRGPRIFLRARGVWGTDVHPQGCRDGHGGEFNFWTDQLEANTVI